MGCCGNHGGEHNHNRKYEIKDNEEKKNSWFLAAVVIFMILMLLISFVI
ncbi:MAG: hypothetical protein Q8P15_00210 [Nanoarchaeota archaeon]|nr:hypothetical protein [Nanoarchaeota archaeon]